MFLKISLSAASVDVCCVALPWLLRFVRRWADCVGFTHKSHAGSGISSAESQVSEVFLHISAMPFESPKSAAREFVRHAGTTAVHSGAFMRDATKLSHKCDNAEN